MSALGKIATRFALRAILRRSPKVQAIAGTPLAVLVGGVLAQWMPPESAAAIAAAVGSIVTTLVGLAFGDDVDGDGVPDSLQGK